MYELSEEAQHVILKAVFDTPKDELTPEQIRVITAYHGLMMAGMELSNALKQGFGLDEIPETRKPNLVVV